MKFEELNKEKDVLYIGGPMSSLPAHNFPAFHEAEKTLRELGFRNVINPANNDGGDISGTWIYYMRQDIKHVSNSDAVVLLPGYEKSKGATLEIHIARALKMPLFLYPSFEELPDPQELDPIDEAKVLVFGDRQRTYGPPTIDFLRTSTMWTGLLVEKLKEGVRIEPEEVGLMMVLLKLSRHMNKKKKDNLTDAHGYLLTVDMVEKDLKK